MKKHLNIFLLLTLIILIPFSLSASKRKTDNNSGMIKSSLLSGLKFRSIGPAFTSGRIADIAVNPDNPSEYYVAAASGNLWKTENSGVTFKPVFDNYGSYSIGCVTIDPNNHNIVWVGTGENNHQRALGYGDGVYKSMDGGKTWKNMGLKNSRQIGMILVNNKNSNIVYVAAEGSVWGPGGDRGLYKTEDGGKTWKKILNISENTGINSMVMDPRNPDVLIVSSEQRRRHVFTKIGGGPETAIYKTEDGGKTWRKLTNGLPKVDMGGIGLAISSVNPDYIYAIIEAADNKGGFFRSTDRGESWIKMSSHHASGQYYNEIFCDPVDVDKVYSVETVSHYTEDGGKTWKTLGLKGKHVDDHALWIDSKNTKHLRVGCDGGLYETFDGGKNWSHFSNLPITQFYRVAVDNSKPFYFVYGGTQDNASMGGPSRSIKSKGVAAEDWFITVFGDGFWSQIDPVNPNIVYSEWQYGNVIRYDRKTKEIKNIKPQPRKGEKTYKWNWNTPLIISSHSHTRLYIAANKVFRSDDMGSSWKVISPDLTAKIDRNSFKVMGKYWGTDAVAKDVSTSLYGTIVSLSESPVNENLLFVGTDDGLIQITENGGKTWKKIDKFPGVPKYTYVSDILASSYDENIVYATFDNRKRDDFKPYVLVSRDKGKTWKSISSNLPDNGTVHTIAQDFKNKNLLFIGTEFGFYFTIDGGKNWVRIKSGLPTIAVRDIALQKRENDIAIATFGRGFYILDDYSPLRELSNNILKKEAYLFPVKPALLYVESGPKYGQGNKYFAKNPPFGAVFTYYLKENYLTSKERRHKVEKKLFKEGKKIKVLSWGEVREENKEISPFLLFNIYDENGNIIRNLRIKPRKGINRVAWDLRYPSTTPVRLKKNKFNPFKKERAGFFVMPGKYKVSISKVIDGKVIELVKPTEFKVVSLNNSSLTNKDLKELTSFRKRVAELTRKLQGAVNLTNELLKNISVVEQTISEIPGGMEKLFPKAREIYNKLDEIMFQMKGFTPKASREEIPPTHPSLMSRLNFLIDSELDTTSAPSKSEYETYRIIEDELKPLIEQLETIKTDDMVEMNRLLEQYKAPWTSGRLIK
jgi:photosystem II stability/assembly factor-like uncharacterized protein